MTTKKFKIAIHSNGYHSDALLAIIGNSNSGIFKVTIEDIKGYIACRNAQFPTLKTIVKGEGETINLFDKDQLEPYMTITECTFDELGEVGEAAENDLSEVLN